MKKFVKPKVKKIYRWAHCSLKLYKYSILIDMANIKHVSLKANQTGKIKRRTLKKWKARAKCSLGEFKHKCSWVPSTVLLGENPLDKYTGQLRFWWVCRKCRSVTQWVWEHELSEPMLSAYRKNTRPYDSEDSNSLEGD